MPKREHESDAEYKARKKAKKAKKKEKKAQEQNQQSSVVVVKEEKESTATKEKKNIIKSDSNHDTTATATTTTTEFKSFSDAPFAQPIQDALKEAGFSEPSPIQAKAWPVVLANQDLIAVAKTGSGKTLGFLLPLFHRISHDDFPDGSTNKNNNNNNNNKSTIPSPRCLVLSPTRELAIQIHGECVKFGAGINIRAECVYGGGPSVGQQIKQLKSNQPQVVIATPGRSCDLLEKANALSLSECCFCVLDEADRMLDMGFEKQLNQIMKALPTQRQTLFFTATWPTSVRKCAAKFLRDGTETTEIFVGGVELAANKAVTQTFVEAQDDEKDKKLYDLLCGLDATKHSVVIFANTKRRVDYVANAFWQEGFAICAVHGDKPQQERDASLKKFVTRECAIMVATDVAARGLDIKGVTHVIQFDMARDVESYVHRIGRTGRAGEVGEAITFWNPDYDKPCSPALVTIAKNAGQKVPPFLEKFQKIKTSKQWKVADAEKMGAELSGAPAVQVAA